MAVGDLESRVSTLEVKTRNMAEDIEELQREVDSLEMLLSKFLSISPGVTYLNPTNNEYSNSVQERVISRLDLNTTPIIGISELPRIAPIGINHQIRKMPELPLTVLAQPITFYAISLGGDDNYIEGISTVEIEQKTDNITLYKHTVNFGNYGTIIFKFVYVAESATLTDYEQGQNDNESFLKFWYEDDEDSYCFTYAGLYYIDAHTHDYYMWTLATDEETVEVLTPNIFMDFSNSPITLPAQGVSQETMINHINETILGGEW